MNLQNYLVADMEAGIKEDKTYWITSLAYILGGVAPESLNQGEIDTILHIYHHNEVRLHAKTPIENRRLIDLGIILESANPDSFGHFLLTLTTKGNDIAIDAMKNNYD